MHGQLSLSILGLAKQTKGLGYAGLGFEAKLSQCIQSFISWGITMYFDTITQTKQDTGRVQILDSGV